MPTVFAYTIDIIFIRFKKKDLLRYFLSIAVSSRSVRAYKICIGRAQGEEELEESGEGAHVQTVCVNRPLPAHRELTHAQLFILSIGNLIWEENIFIKYLPHPMPIFIAVNFG